MRAGTYKHSEETKKKIGLKSKGRYCSPETRLKISKAHKGKEKPKLQGALHHKWKGGISGSQMLRTISRPKPDKCEVCNISGSINKICADHDHTTIKFRGWICARCNTALGMVKDNPETLIALAEYINKSKNENR